MLAMSSMIFAMSAPACPANARAGMSASTPPNNCAMASVEPPVFSVTCCMNGTNPPAAATPAAEKLSPSDAAMSLASFVGLTIAAMIARTPVTASVVLMPPFVNAATEATSSSTPMPNLAAKGAAFPSVPDSSPIVVLPAFIPTKSASLTLVASVEAKP